MTWCAEISMKAYVEAESEEEALQLVENGEAYNIETSIDTVKMVDDGELEGKDL